MTPYAWSAISDQLTDPPFFQFLSFNEEPTKVAASSGQSHVTLNPGHSQPAVALPVNLNLFRLRCNLYIQSEAKWRENFNFFCAKLWASELSRKLLWCFFPSLGTWRFLSYNLWISKHYLHGMTERQHSWRLIMVCQKFNNCDFFRLEVDGWMDGCACLSYHFWRECYSVLFFKVF
jgi:hypothetical protein